MKKTPLTPPVPPHEPTPPSLPDKGTPKVPRFRLLNTLSGIALIFMFLVSTYAIMADRHPASEDISLSVLAADIAQGKVASMTVVGNDIEAHYRAATTTATTTASPSSVTGLGALMATGSTELATPPSLIRRTQKETDAPLIATLNRLGVTSDMLSKVTITYKSPSGVGFWFVQLVPFLAPFLVVLLLAWFITRQVRGAGAQALTFGQSKARMIRPDDTRQRVTFKDVAGAKEAKQELAEIVDFLRNPKKFIDIGAQIPKGVLLMGAPGTGKTLLARAVAGEANVAFFSISGSEFVEMFVGVGASRVRDLFALAKEAAPAIIFVDEIDAVGRVRGSGTGGGNDEREQTLNQILVEMDGFEPSEKVIVMAATNRPDVLDPALLRPGRFDRRVTIDLPDRNDRFDILNVHAVKKPLAEDVNLRLIAERTPGFSGADLQSLMNEAAILAARENRSKVAQFDLIRAIEKVMLGPERKSHLLSVKEKEITAFHEAGHALVASVLPYADPVHKISIISRGRAAGYTLHLPLEDRKMQSRNEFLDDIAVSLGGYVVEQKIFGDVTTGPSNDLQVSTALARDMVTKYGMSPLLGARAFEGVGGRSMFGRGLEERDYSEKVGAEIDAEVSRIMAEAFARVEAVIEAHRPALEAIARRLIVTETIEREEFENIIIAHGIQPKKKLDIEHQG